MEINYNIGRNFNYLSNGTYNPFIWAYQKESEIPKVIEPEKVIMPKKEDNSEKEKGLITKIEQETPLNPEGN